MVVKRSIRIVAQQGKVFDYVSDHRNVPRFMKSVVDFEPTSRQTSGLGSRFRWRVSVRGIKLGAEFEVVEHRRPEWMAAETISGPKSESCWHFRQDGDTTEVSFAVGYELPRLPLVSLLGSGYIAREIGNLLESSLKQLKKNLEAERMVA
jgi:uncharacterized membrane protein